MITKNDIKNIGIAGLLFDVNTGDVLGDFGNKRPRKECTLTNWLMMFHEGTLLMATDKELGLEAWRVFAYAISFVDYDNRITATQASIAKGLDMKQPNVARAFKLLTKKGIFVEGEKMGASKGYYLGTIIGNKGRTRNFKKKQQDEQIARNNQSYQNDVDPPSSSKSEGLIAV